MSEETKVSSGIPVKRVSTVMEIHLTKEENGNDLT